MKIHNVDQGTDAWHKLRIGKITASRLNAVMSDNAKLGREKYLIELAEEIRTGERRESFKNYWMDRGTKLESEARSYYEFMKDVDVDECGFIEISEYFGVSPDGFLKKEKKGIEIKCPKLETHMKYIKSNTVPAQYKWQVHAEMIALCADSVDFISYFPGSEIDGAPPAGFDEMHIINVSRDKNIQAEIMRRVYLFNQELQKIVSSFKK